MNIHKKISPCFPGPHERMRLREVSSVDPVFVGAAKYSRNADSRRQLLAKAGPGSTRTVAGVTELSKSDLVSARVTATPLPPALRVDDVGQSGVLEDNASIVPPGATKVVRTRLDGVARSSRDLRLVDDIV